MTPSADQVRAEIADLKAYLSGLPDEYRTSPYGQTYGQRLEQLLGQLADLELARTAIRTNMPALDLSIRGLVIKDHRVPSALLGEFLQRWQGLFSALGQAALGKPTSRGLIQADILAGTTLDVLTFAEGSFLTRVVLQGPPQATIPTQHVGLLAFGEFEKLCSAGPRHHELSVQMHRLKGRVLSSYGRLLETLVQWDASFSVTLAEPTSSTLRRTSVPASVAREVLPMLGQVGSEARENPQSLVGLLNAANRRTGSFEIDLGEDGVLSGRVGAGANILDGVTIGQRYTFGLNEVITTDRLTGTLDATWLLESVQSPA